MNSQQMNVYQLAENLGMTVTRMLREMTMSEYFGWVAFYAEKAERDSSAAGKAPKLRPKKGDELVLRGFNI
jgi:hypothetical protein